MKCRRLEQIETQIFPELISSQTMQDLTAVPNKGLSEDAVYQTEVKVTISSLL